MVPANLTPDAVRDLQRIRTLVFTSGLGAGKEDVEKSVALGQQGKQDWPTLGEACGRRADCGYVTGSPTYCKSKAQCLSPAGLAVVQLVRAGCLGWGETAVLVLALLLPSCVASRKGLHLSGISFCEMAL